ncbi:hypothetical protein [Variovorax sp. MHTC-1]|uniref:hypothetical protein n=1 Tax=Variovorax sp. MHTC-1 TaxID=2495593 RepID=UPI00163CDFF6|nr:hypothetical protein [Variovorax sp. MHTC-1]
MKIKILPAKTAFAALRAFRLIDVLKKRLHPSGCSAASNCKRHQLQKCRRCRKHVEIADQDDGRAGVEQSTRMSDQPLSPRLSKGPL